MAATGIFADAITKVAASITGLGLRAVTDPRNLAPRCVFIELPRFTGFNFNVADITISVQVIAAPPGNTDATDYLISTVDTIMAADLAIVSGEPITLIIGEQQFPAYELVCRLSSQRN